MRAGAAGIRSSHVQLVTGTLDPAIRQSMSPDDDPKEKIVDVSGEYRIQAPRGQVWAALNDPNILKQAIPGCESFERTGENELEAKVKARIGPINARFAGKITLSDLNPPESYRIGGEGKGGVAGFAKGGANVTLSEDGDGTILRYTASADIGGKLAQIGSRFVKGSAKKIADDFFGRFAKIVCEQQNAG
ncbi:hypothetical protein SAMN07250955_103220 [Arboricoccus pini]|uniref:Carbon monoxide dehydrogenase subunit G n=1 Tax=Arboricoccus pini TaxID=1963835 RepID=A0A212QTL6_9PROT|nr:carbon monoxide dehydrogenase subunit G [Arboricoccus pini]SNB62955.1 hypothetical protein SAMN07250955_103220 [Arboricoccus pini]